MRVTSDMAALQRQRRSIHRIEAKCQQVLTQESGEPAAPANWEWGQQARAVGRRTLWAAGAVEREPQAQLRHGPLPSLLSADWHPAFDARPQPGRLGLGLRRVHHVPPVGQAGGTGGAMIVNAAATGRKKQPGDVPVVGFSFSDLSPFSDCKRLTETQRTLAIELVALLPAILDRAF